MNPYASQLGELDPVEVIAGMPGRIESLFKALGPERSGQAVAPGKWSPREVLCHLADCELAFAFRLRQTLAEPNHIIQPFDQDKWMAACSSYDVALALAVFVSVRNWNLTLVRSIPTEALATPVSHPERGEMTFAGLLEIMAGHDLNHVRQLETLAGTS